MITEHARILLKLFDWLNDRSVILTLALLAVMVASAIAVVDVVHMNRSLYGELQGSQKQQDFLDYEYEKLLLEQSAWSEYSRVEKISRSELQMRIPASNEIVMVQDVVNKNNR